MAHPAVAVLEYQLVGYRRVWRSSLFSSFLIPVLFFLGMGVAVGSYVDRGGALDVPYLQFIGPGLLAFTGAQIAMIESGFPVLGGFKWRRTYFGMAAAPPRVGDIVAGHMGFVAFRVAIGTTAFLLVMLPFGALRSPAAVALPAIAILVAVAVAAPVLAYAATIDSPNLMAVLFRFGMLPMMLFSGVFFPVTQLPALLRPVAYGLPLWHGVELCRSAALGIAAAWPVPAHVAVLGGWAVAGFMLARARFARRLAR